ncbi:hypothetical protein OU798_00230 [Prolixibacteraceae bacterium Z1-6]|uniref:Uncharacterized protein n=1 Tax=Draconibacterium aestuarii TaxID=2998507 RepID=A0A9X3F2S6_9BACT|nr:hypothetical protein [Prolixibacteraceae bacterium Z1-6]
MILLKKKKAYFFEYYGVVVAFILILSCTPVHLDDGGRVCRINTPKLLQELGLLETLKYRDKIYCLNDSPWGYGMIHQPQLPLSVDRINSEKVEIFIGDDTRKIVPEEVILFFRLNHSVDFQISINGNNINDEISDYVLLYDKARGLSEYEREYAFSVPVESIRQGNNTVPFFGGDSSFVVKRLEIALKYGEAETHGYFS